MAKEVAISKRVKISEAQQYMLLSVLAASVVLGISIALIVNFAKHISFNSKVISAEEKSIADYSEVIKTTGICKSPSGATYSEKELKDCQPDSIEISEIPGTLRANILQKTAANAALNSVPKENDASCLSPTTGKGYTYAELEKIYNDAKNSTALQEANQLIKRCSALRIIPDALPAYKNEEALLASLNKLFIISNWEPESISPSGNSTSSSQSSQLHEIAVNLSVESSPETTTTVLRNIERSIREFDFKRATIEWGKNGQLSLVENASAYYTDKANISESTTVIKAEGSK